VQFRQFFIQTHTRKTRGNTTAKLRGRQCMLADRMTQNLAHLFLHASSVLRGALLQPSLDFGF